MDDTDFSGAFCSITATVGCAVLEREGTVHRFEPSGVARPDDEISPRRIERPVPSGTNDARSQFELITVERVALQIDSGVRDIPVHSDESNEKGSSAGVVDVEGDTTVRLYVDILRDAVDWFPDPLTDPPVGGLGFHVEVLREVGDKLIREHDIEASLVRRAGDPLVLTVERSIYQYGLLDVGVLSKSYDQLSSLVTMTFEDVCSGLIVVRRYPQT
ncbi:hypothetical protein IL252_09915 [Halomicrobium sp. IBSBa]|uniref:hypothetical protein n=1 Tax=Halomicrobium sp. IBSBa TaxID=2778916 RepID=UPI001ABF33D6|nr:hypothetical protein [Halomicrobium sp. IBSBa]MBO4248129.1 hypothetical protein [Halomicrobium sp. IBSBa]